MFYKYVEASNFVSAKAILLKRDYRLQIEFAIGCAFAWIEPLAYLAGDCEICTCSACIQASLCMSRGSSVRGAMCSTAGTHGQNHVGPLRWAKLDVELCSIFSIGTENSTPPSSCEEVFCLPIEPLDDSRAEHCSLSYLRPLINYLV